jgi:hypothetical protein
MIASMPLAPCDLCGTVAMLQPWRPQASGGDERQCCEQCVAKDRRRRSKAAKNNGGYQPGGGRPPKALKDKEGESWRFYLTKAATKRLEAWLDAQGHAGESRHAKMKAWALSVIGD